MSDKEKSTDTRPLPAGGGFFVEVMVITDWFTWNGVRCTAYGIHVVRQPEIIRPSERATFTSVPGRSGTLTTLEADDVYDDFILSVECFISDLSMMSTIFGWLRGSGTITFANRQGGFYYARIVNQISLEQVLRGNPHRTFAINFRCQPFFYLSGITDLTLTSSYQIVNKGSNSTVTSVASPVLTGSHVTVTATIPDALPEGTEWLAVRFYSNYSNAAVTVGSYCEFTNIMLEIGENESPYEPYRGDRYVLTLPEMIYGTDAFPTIIDCKGGIVSVQEIGIVLTGNETWVISSSGESSTYRLAIAGKSDRTHGRCSHYPTSYASPVGTTEQVYTPGTTSNPSMILIRPDLSLYPDLASFKTMLAAQHAAGTPVVCTWLQPKALAIDPVNISALSGFNTVYSDGGGESSLAGQVTGQWMYGEIAALKKLVAALTP